MNVRRAVPLDADKIAEVHVKSWQSAYQGLLPDAYLANLSVERRTRMWRQILADEGVVVFVTTDPDSGIVGFSCLQASRDSDAPEGVGEITAIYLLPTHWGRGLGRALMSSTLRGARERNYRRVTLWVLDSNVRARRFYENAGFVKDGAEKTETLPGSILLQEVRYGMDLT